MQHNHPSGPDKNWYKRFYWIMGIGLTVFISGLIITMVVYGGIQKAAHENNHAKAVLISSSSSGKPSESSSNIPSSSKGGSTKNIKKVPRYMNVSLTNFTENTDNYVGKNIRTSGTVAYVQKNPDDSTMYYAVIVPKDEYDSTGYSTGHGTVTEIDTDLMKENGIHEGDTITVRGGGLQDTVKLNGKTLNSDIIVDSVSK